MNETIASEMSEDVMEQDDSENNDFKEREAVIENDIDIEHCSDVEAIVSENNTQTGGPGTLSDDDEGTTDPTTEPTTELMVDESVISASESVPNDLYESKIEDDQQV